ncbi:MAG: crossover junction endodeoxyribonuclease RuvC [Calditrichaeota bacterium]|nr:MAG: crossover junction endodeoxyribonuclease RuvC [Calditrichota bacterium]
MRILGLDPGLNITGYGILEREDGNIKIVEAGIIKPNSKLPLENRLLELGDELDNIISQFKPDLIAIEELYSHYGHPKTAIIMGHARGILFYKAAESKIAVTSYASTKIKNSLTGNGRASKQQVQYMVTSTLNLTQLPEPADVADALAVALCHLRTIEHEKVINS